MYQQQKKLAACENVLWNRNNLNYTDADESGLYAIVKLSRVEKTKLNFVTAWRNYTNKVIC